MAICVYVKVVGGTAKCYVALSVCGFVEASVTPVEVFTSGEGGAVIKVVNVDTVVGDSGEYGFEAVVFVHCLTGEYIDKELVVRYNVAT